MIDKHALDCVNICHVVPCEISHELSILSVYLISLELSSLCVYLIVRNISNSNLAFISTHIFLFISTLCALIFQAHRGQNEPFNRSTLYV